MSEFERIWLPAMITAGLYILLLVVGAWLIYRKR